LFRDPLVPSLLAAFIFIVAIVVGVLWLLTSQIRATEIVEDTLEADQAMARVLQAMTDADSGQRGYLVTLDPLFLEPYTEARNSIGTDLAILRDRVSDNAAQSERAEQLAQLIDERLIQLNEVMEDSRVSDQARQAGLRRGKTMMDDIRDRIAEMRGQERQLLIVRQADVERFSRRLVSGLTISAIALTILALLTLRRVAMQVRTTIEARDALDRSNQELRAAAQQREAAETQARQLQKMEAVGQLTGGIAHDFNNMLAIVIGSLDLARLRLKKKDFAKISASIEAALGGAQRASQLTARLMAFARQQPLAPKAVDAQKLVEGMSDLLRRTLGEAVQIETIVDDDGRGGLWRCFVDPHQLENALVNLCVNGRDAMPDGGRLTIVTANAALDANDAAANEDILSGDYVLVAVTDSGTGMPPEVVERAFDPFYTTKGVGRGTGLGLSQVHGFVKQSGGHIKIVSAPDKGTTVKLFLPRAAPGIVDTDWPVSQDHPAVLPHAHGAETILVVEDDERVRRTTVDSLRELGYGVLQAADARQALAILAVQTGVDLVFTDVVMPDMNGRQLAEEVGRRYPALRILFTTGYSRDEIVHNGMLDEDVTLLPKPFTFDQLANKIRQMLDRAVQDAG
jgi:signal transduction histidine kinase/ActR/RegA family two-component response regulator